jgi:hypothetical protein
VAGWAGHLGRPLLPRHDTPVPGIVAKLLNRVMECDRDSTPNSP